MKLNNNGWGMKDMVIFMSILLVFLLLAIYNVNKLYRAMEHTQNNVRETPIQHKEEGSEIPTVSEVKKEEEKLDEAYYKDLEVEFNRATRDYLNHYKYDLHNEIFKITSDSLEGLKFIEMKDQFGKKTCDGYSNVYFDTEKDDYVIKSYIRCANYMTEGY